VKHHHHHNKEEKARENFAHLAEVLTKINNHELVIEQPPTNGKEAWERLKRGNKRFAKGELVGFLSHIALEINPDKRSELMNGQHPFATVVTCSDSRVAPELIFDEGLGDIFVVRIAGNVLDTTAIGSIEYGVLHLKTPLLVLMGHQSCGAVTAAMNCSLESIPSGNIGEGILKKILPIVEKAKKSSDDPKRQLERAIQENVIQSKEYLLGHSNIVKDLIEKGDLHFVIAEYHLKSGVVHVIQSDI